MKNGTVKWFDAKKGFGFILDNEDGKEYFVHHTGILMDGFRFLNVGDKVEFELIDNKGKSKAVNVKVIQ